MTIQRGNFNFAGDRCSCYCGCHEVITKQEHRFFKGRCIACGGGFHGLQTMLRQQASAASKEAEPTGKEG